MKKIKTNLFSPASIALFAVLVFTMSGCVKQEASKVESVKNPAVIASASHPDIDAAQKLVEKMPDSALGYNKLAVAYIRRARETGDFSLNTNAQTAINRALEIEPQNSDAQKLKASLLLTFHRFDEALNLGKQLEKDHPQDPFIYGVLSDANVELGNYKEAIDAAQKMIDLKPNTASYARVAHLRSLLGDHEGAIEMFKLAARTADPLDKEAQSWCLVYLGDELWKYGKYAEAEKVYDEALQNFPNYHLAIAGKGRARAAQGDFENAIKFLTDANNRVPNVETAILLGDIYTKQNEAEKAKQQYDLVEIIEQKIGVSNDQKRLAMLWADQNIKLDEALAIAQREHAARKDIFTADTLCWVLYKKGQFQEAKKVSDEAMHLKTNDARIIYHAAMIEKELGNKKEAARLLQTALKLNPSFDLLQAENAKNSLKELS